MKKVLPFKELRFFLLFVFILLVKNNFGQKLIELKNDTPENYIGKYLEILEDDGKNYNFQEILKSNGFKPSTSAVPNLGVTDKHNWIKFTALNLSGQKEFIIQLALSTIDYVDYYAIYDDGRIDSLKTGDCRAFNSRKYNRPDFVFDLNFSTAKQATVLFKVSGGEQVQAPINIGEKTSMLLSFIGEDILMGIYLGIVCTMILYNIFVFFSTRDRSYLFYVLYILIVGLTQLNFLGYAYKYFWADSIYVSNMAVYILSCFTAIFAMEFMKRFLFTKEKVPGLHKYFIVFYVIYYIAIILALLRKFNWSYQVIQIDAMLAASFMLFVAWKISRQGFRPAKFFLVAWSTFLVGVCVFVMKDMGILPYNKMTYYTMPIGSAFEVILLSLALADRINILKKEKEDSIAKTLQLSIENEKIIKEQNINLEIKVQERTAELEASNKSLKEAESILVNAEKMASLGQLTAGISHEINNPINFVVSNIKPLKRDVQEILMILDKYNEIKGASDLQKKLEEIELLKKKLDSDYLKDEINLLLKGIDEGANRTAEIVKGLKNFARTDEGDLKKIDIHEGIDATLTLLNNSITNKNITVIRKFGELPTVECYPGKINQVLMNLLSNAIDALKSSKIENHNGIITIETKLNNNNVIIRISDNGPGIPPVIISKIFDPFYTTKDVGEGTGLGLSIVYGIIKSHSGKIDVQSEENKNTTFTITLPVQQ
jgi:signal transduction histidine kinase